MALTGYGMTSLYTPGRDRNADLRLWGAFIAGVALIAMADLRFCAATAIGISCMLPWHNRRRAYKRGAWLTAIVAAAWIAGNLVDSSAGEIPEHAHLVGGLADRIAGRNNQAVSRTVALGKRRERNRSNLVCDRRAHHLLCHTTMASQPERSPAHVGMRRHAMDSHGMLLRRRLLATGSRFSSVDDTRSD